MQRCFVRASFKGTNYHGWQIQPNEISVQQVIEDALSVLLQETISVTGAGRTDAGVHASCYIFHFDSEKLWADSAKLIYRLNRILPFDIAIQKIWNVPPDAHARFSAVSRTYKYYVSLVKNPFTDDTELYMSAAPSVDLMNEAAKMIFQYTDFTSFSRLHSDVKTNICIVQHAMWTSENNRLIFTIKADRFLRNMVRAIVGTLLKVGTGKLSLTDFRNIIEAK